MTRGRGPLEADNCRLPFETRVFLKLFETDCPTCGSSSWCVTRDGSVTAQGPSGFHVERREQYERVRENLDRHRQRDYNPLYPVRCGRCGQQTPGAPCVYCGACPNCGGTEPRPHHQRAGVVS